MKVKMKDYANNEVVVEINNPETVCTAMLLKISGDQKLIIWRYKEPGREEYDTNYRTVDYYDGIKPVSRKFFKEGVTLDLRKWI